MKGSRATWSIQPRLQHHVDAGARRLTGSTVRRCFAHYWRISAANLGCARWSKRRPRRRGPPPSLPRAQSIDQRTGPARQPDQRAALRARRIRLRAAAPQSTATAQRVEDGRWPSLAKHLKTQISRELDRLELLLEQIKAVETERDALLAAQKVALPGRGHVTGFQWHRARIHRGSLVRRTVPALRQSAPSCFLCRLRRRLGKVDRRSRAGSFESRQSSIADNTHSTRLAMAAPSAAIRAGFVV